MTILNPHRHPVDTVILTGLALGHVVIAAAIARAVLALIRWSRRDA